ncbi:unnamed protein product [Lactuca virosa]|uniref:F-BAR domain-containing protein n=1 Tax=Lactuca virosa TaxID=75947 RepID=A0AAU9LS41_9ASTR|nr:unnamed protein product [Lactuca virosa]
MKHGIKKSEEGLREFVASSSFSFDSGTIRGFGQEKRFMKRNLYLLDCFASPFFCSIAAIEWFCLHMELISTFVFAFCLVLLVSFPCKAIDPSMAGLVVTYGQPLLLIASSSFHLKKSSSFLMPGSAGFPSVKIVVVGTGTASIYAGFTSFETSCRECLKGGCILFQWKEDLSKEPQVEQELMLVMLNVNQTTRSKNKLNQTNNVLANTEETLKKCQYALKQRDFIIEEQKKAAREDKLNAGNRSVINKFECKLAQDVGSLSNMVAASVSQQNEQLQCIEKFYNIFISINDQAMAELKKKVYASKNLYISHIEALENIVRLHKESVNGSLEDISSMASSNARYVEELLAEESAQGRSIFDVLQGTLSTQR